MPTRTDESPPRQQDRAPERGRSSPDEPRNFETTPGQKDRNHDTAVMSIDVPDINTDGSER
jgi:hypothetical protein